MHDYVYLKKKVKIIIGNSIVEGVSSADRGRSTNGRASRELRNEEVEFERPHAALFLKCNVSLHYYWKIVERG